MFGSSSRRREGRLLGHRSFRPVSGFGARNGRATVLAYSNVHVMFYSWSGGVQHDVRVPNMFEQYLLPGFEPVAALDYLFFALLLRGEDASPILQLRERLRLEHGLKGQLIAANLLHISLHGIGAYHGLPRAKVEMAKQAAARVSMRPLDIVFDYAMSFGRKREGQPFVLRACNDAALMSFYRLLGEAMKSVGISRSHFAFYAAHDPAVRRSYRERAGHRGNSMDGVRFRPCAKPSRSWP